MKGVTISRIRSDHDGEFENHNLKTFMKKMIQNMNSLLQGLHEKIGQLKEKNRSPQEMAKTMLKENNLSRYFWEEVVNTASYIMNYVLLRPLTKKPHMSYGMMEKQTSTILRSSIVNVSPSIQSPVAYS